MFLKALVIVPSNQFIPVEFPIFKLISKEVKNISDFSHSKKRTSFFRTKGFFHIFDGFFLKTKGFLPGAYEVLGE